MMCVLVGCDEGKFQSTFMAKKEASAIPVFGSLIKVGQCILVDRFNPNSRHDSLEELKRRAKEVSKWNCRVMLFPEGTTTNSRALISFKLGAFLCGVPLQPCIFQFKNKYCDPGWVEIGPQALGSTLR